MKAAARWFFCIALGLQACADNGDRNRQVHTSFSELTGLTVVDDKGNSQLLIKGSLASRAVVSADGQWIAAEDMKMSNLVVVRVFRFNGDRYQEIPMPELRQHWVTLARKAGVEIEDLIRPRVGVEKFGASGTSVILSFQADTGMGDSPVIDALVEIKLIPES